jgi:hypothetical protein
MQILKPIGIGKLFMDRRMMLNHVAQARHHVAEGEAHIARQRELVAELERDGHDASDARRLLAQFIVMQTMHMDDCERLERALSESPSDIVTKR